MCVRNQKKFNCSFLQLLKREFSETRAAVPESLMFVKEDLIIPHFYTLVLVSLKRTALSEVCRPPPPLVEFKFFF